MHPHPPHNQPPQRPVVYVNKGSKATTVGVWVIVLAIVGPAVLILLCCAGLFLGGLV